MSSDHGETAKATRRKGEEGRGAEWMGSSVAGVDGGAPLGVGPELAGDLRLVVVHQNDMLGWVQENVAGERTRARHQRASVPLHPLLPSF